MVKFQTASLAMNTIEYPLCAAKDERAFSMRTRHCILLTSLPKVQQLTPASHNAPREIRGASVAAARASNRGLLGSHCSSKPFKKEATHEGVASIRRDGRVSRKRVEGAKVI